MVLETLNDARTNELPSYRARFHGRVPDPGDMLRHCALHGIAFVLVEAPSTFKDAWSALRQFGKSGVYSDEDVDTQIDIMLAELDKIEMEVTSRLESVVDAQVVVRSDS